MVIMIPSCSGTLAGTTWPLASARPSRQAHTPSAVPLFRSARPSVRCAATPRGRPRKGSPEDEAQRRRQQSAQNVEVTIEDAGAQLGDAIGSVVQNAEGAAADTASQTAGTAARAENAGIDMARTSATPAARSAGVDSASYAADLRRQAASASAQRRSTQQEDAAQAEDAVRDQASQVAGAVSDGIKSVPTPGEAVQDAADGAAGVISGLGQVAGAVSEVAEDAQKNVEGFARDVQRGGESRARDLQRDVNRFSAQADRAARDFQYGATYNRGRDLISNSTQLTSISAYTSAEDDEAVAYQKTRLLAHIAGLDRGFAANARQADLVETAAQALVSAGGPVNLSYAVPSAAPPASSAGSSPGGSSDAITPTSFEASAGGPSVTTEVASIPAAGPGSAAAPQPGPGVPPVPGANSGDGGKPKRSSMAQLSGVWRLVYSSGFAARRSTGGARPGLPINLLPAQFGQVYQGIALDQARLDNIVELRRGALPSLPFGPKNEDAQALLTLKHSLEVTGPQTLRITFVGTDVSLQGGIGGLLNSLPEFTLPELPEGLRPSKGLRGGSFTVLFLDEDLRITRGDRNELRIFVRT